MEDINQLANYCLDRENCSFICLTASLDQQIQQFKKETDAPFTFYNTDEITLKTIIRANPGLLLLKRGTILDKWHHNDLPSPSGAEDEYLDNPVYKESETVQKLKEVSS